jgi:glycosyltransferase involved in cell wall biosynthesis
MQANMKLKVVICWSDLSGYMAACWRALNDSAEVDVFVLAFKGSKETAFNEERLMQGIPCQLLDYEARQDSIAIEQIVLAQQPDVVYICGWLHQPYCKLVSAAKLQQVAFIMGMDTPWKDNFRQRIGPILLRSYLQRMQRIVVIGERSWQCASRFGIPPERIERSYCGVDYDRWSPLWAQRTQQSAPISSPVNWPKSFLFIGRYIPIKAIDVLVQAYLEYRELVEEPWDLVCCGQGELKHQLTGQPGIIDRGFIQPGDMEDVWRSAGAFIMPSRFDPWPVAIVEAAAAGLPIICTDACGSAVELVRSWYNGLVVPEDNVAELTRTLVIFHDRHAELATWGKRSQELAAPYATRFWVDRWKALLADAVRSNPVSATKILATASPQAMTTNTPGTTQG